MIVNFRLILVLMITLGYGSFVNACRCSGGSTTEDDFKTAQAVFSGEVIRVEAITNPKSEKKDILYSNITLRIIESWKGDVGREITLSTMRGICDYFMNADASLLGIKLLIFAYKIEVDDENIYQPKAPFWVASSCGNTGLLKNAKKDLKILRQIRKRN